MKHTFKKVVSLLLAVMMIMSLCTVAFATEDVPTWLDFGIVDGTGTSSGEIVKLGDDYVIKMGGYDANHNLRLANKLADPNSENPDAPFVMVAGTVYTVMFDYMMENKVGFSIRPMLDPVAANERGDHLTTHSDGISDQFIGDGKWHTAALTFVGATPYKKGSDTVVLNNLGLLHQLYDTKLGTAGYLKNIRIITETATSASFYGNEEIAIQNVITNGGALVKGSGMTSNYDQNGNTVTLNADKSVSFKLVGLTKAGTVGASGWYNCITPTTKKGNANPYQLNTERNYLVTVRYKVDVANTAGTIGIGYAKNSTATGSSETYCAALRKYAGVSNGWESFTAELSPAATSNLKLLLTGDKGNVVTIGDITVSYVDKTATAAALYTFNDNGQYVGRAGYIGASIIAFGSNDVNEALGEKFMGWYTTPYYETAVDTYNAENKYLYAKYPTTVIDTFEAINYYTNENEKKSGATVTDQGGVLKVASNSNGAFRIPAYDAAITDGFKFTVGKEFRVSVYYNSISVSGAAQSDVQFITGDRYGSAGTRASNARFNVKVSAKATPGVITQIVKNNSTLKDKAAGQLIETGKSAQGQYWRCRG